MCAVIYWTHYECKTRMSQFLIWIVVLLFNSCLVPNKPTDRDLLMLLLWINENVSVFFGLYCFLFYSCLVPTEITEPTEPTEPTRTKKKLPSRLRTIIIRFRNEVSERRFEIWFSSSQSKPRTLKSTAETKLRKHKIASNWAKHIHILPIKWAVSIILNYN